MKDFYIYAICLIVSVSTAFAQPDSLWSRTYGGHSADWCNDHILMENGGYILAGYTASFSAGSDDFWLVITNENGDSLESFSYGGSSIDQCNSVIQTEDGGFALAGLTRSFGAGWQDFWLVKTTGAGDSLWSRTYGGRFDEACNKIIRTSDDALLLAGRTSTFDAGWQDMWIIKIDQNGDSLWAQRYGGGDLDECMSIQQTTDGGYVLAGWTDSYGAGAYDFWLVKTNENGDSLWSRTYGGGNHDVCYDVKQTSDGGYILAGRTASFGAGNDDFYLVKTDENGNSLWSRTYGGSNYEKCYSVLQTSEGGYLLAGTTSSYGVGNYDSWLLRVNSEGDSLWSMTFGGSQGETCFSVLNSNYSGYALAGYSFSSENGDFWLARTGFDPTPAPPIPFSRLLPVDSSLQRLSPVELSWDESFDPNGTSISYLLHVESTHPEFETLDTTVDVSHFNLIMPMLDESSLDEIFEVSWCVSAISEGDTTEANSAGLFFIDTPEPPGPFERVLPIDSSYTDWPLDTFTWTRSVDPNGDEVTYLFHIESDMPGYELFENVTTDTILMFDRTLSSGTLDEPYTFNWTVHAVANGDTVEASNGEGIYFYDAPRPPGPFSRLMPEDSSTIELTPEQATVVFSWSESIDPNGDLVSYLFHLESPTYSGEYYPADTVLFTTSVTVTVFVDIETLDDIHDFFWTVHATDEMETIGAANGQGYFHMDIPGAADEHTELPTEYSLSVYPNPFNPSTTIHYNIPQQAFTSITVFDLLGREVAQLLNETKTAGSYSINWDCAGYTAGVYLIELKSGSYSQIMKAILLR